MNSNTAWICTDCGKMFLIPNVDAENDLVCPFCRKPGLKKIPLEQMAVQGDDRLTPGTTPIVVVLQNYIYWKATKAIENGHFTDMDDLINTALAQFSTRVE